MTLDDQLELDVERVLASEEGMRVFAALIESFGVMRSTFDASKTIDPSAMLVNEGRRRAGIQVYVMANATPSRQQRYHRAVEQREEMREKGDSHV